MARSQALRSSSPAGASSLESVWASCLIRYFELLTQVLGFVLGFLVVVLVVVDLDRCLYCLRLHGLRREAACRDGTDEG